MRSSHRRIALLLTTVILTFGTVHEAAGQAGPTGEVIVAWHVTIAPTWFDPSSAPPQITPFGTLYAIHDALARPLPNQKMGPSLAESWTESPDGLTYEFKLRRGLKFHNGDPVTTEDVKFSFERYKGAGAKEFHTRVRAVEIVDPLTIRFRLGSPWPDFMTFYGTTATGAGIVVPKKYLTQVGDDGCRKHPIGAGPYKFVSHAPGVDVVLEAYTGYWRRVPNVKRLVLKSVPDGSTRLAMLKTGEADIAVALDGPEGIEVRRDPRLQLVASRHASIFWIEFADQWDAKSPWHDKRLRQAVNLSLDRKTTNEAACLGFCPPAGGACGLLRRVAREEAARALHDRGRQLRQRRQPGDGVHQLQGSLRVWRLSGDRRSRPAASRRARREEARGAAASHPADDDRSGDVRADHGPARPDGSRSEDGGPHDQPGADDGVAVLR